MSRKRVLPEKKKKRKKKKRKRETEKGNQTKKDGDKLRKYGMQKKKRGRTEIEKRVKDSFVGSRWVAYQFSYRFIGGIVCCGSVIFLV